MYFIFLSIGGLMAVIPWLTSDVNMITFTNSLLFAILLTMSSIIISRAIAEKNSQTDKEINEKLDTLLKKFEANKPEMVEIKQPEFDTKELPNILKEWEVVIQTQMHFNDLLMKVRTATLSVVLAVFGAAGYSILNKDAFLLTVNEFILHPSVLIISSGIVILFSMFIIDYGYYYKMLVGAVRRGLEFDNEFRSSLGRKYFGMTTMIRDEIGKAGKSKYFIISFYWIPIAAGIIFLLAVLIGFQPSQLN